MSTAQLHLSPALAPGHVRGGRSALAVAAWMLAAALPLVGLVSLLLREKLDPNWHNHSAHFAVFLTVGLGVFVLAYAAGGAANRRGDARVLLISIAFLATGGFLGLHAPGTTGVLSQRSTRDSRSRIPSASSSQPSSPSRPDSSICVHRSRHS